MKQKSFTALGISGRFSDVLAKAGFSNPTEIQQLAIPIVLGGNDVLGVAQTGTGKTAAFGLPLLHLLTEQDRPAKPKHPRALVLAPTRELASQIYTELKAFADATNLRLTCIFGGVGQHPQIKALRNGVDVLIATPGRLLDLTSQGALKLSHVAYLVLDEADRLLDMGFAPDVKRIVGQVPDKRRSLLFSATMPKEVTRLADNILHNPRRVDVSPREVTVAKIEQRMAWVEKNDKQRALTHLLQAREAVKVIVFTRTKHGADRVVKKLHKAGIESEAIHGNKSQNARTRALRNFAGGDIWVLVATDIAARGIDIEGVSHVINFDIPHEPESYVHRIGRTGRAGAFGVAWSLVEPAEKKYWKGVQRLIGFSPEAMELELHEDEKTGAQAALISRQPNRSKQDISENAGSDERLGGGERRARRRPGRRRRSRKNANASV